ncbi:MAG: SMP-30/gluconolactonase/LRE family protein [Bacteroidales bacterium]|nr:SMP-30/gluconolactonase/LRE family protein [Bacteroidales bacterium]
MRKLHFLLISIICLTCTQNKIYQKIDLHQELNTETFIQSFSNANMAMEDSDSKAYLDACAKIHKFSPSDPALSLYYADALWKNNDKEKAEEQLRKLSLSEDPQINVWLKDNEYAHFQELDIYADLLTKSELKTKPVNTSKIAFVLPEKDLIPEGVAYDKLNKTLFISSIYKRKILAIDAAGNISDFIETGESGISSVIGMEVDSKKRELWACSAFDENTIDTTKMDKSSGVYKFDLETGKLIKKYLLKDTTECLINDITIHPNGTAFITESNNGKVYMIQPEKDRLELFIDSDYYCYANGITLSDDGKYLFVGYYSGIDRINLLTSKVEKIKYPEGIFIGKIDGLAFYKNTLIANHPTSLNGIYQYKLNKEQDSILNYKVIEKNNPLFEFPTTGEIVGDEFYYIANAQLRRFNENGKIFPIEKLDSVYILKASIQE